MMTPISLSTPTFGALRVAQQREVATARNGGKLSQAEAVIYDSIAWQDRGGLTDGRNLKSPMKDETVQALTEAIQKETRRFEDFSGAWDAKAKPRALQTLDAVFQLLKETSDRVPDEVVTALVEGYQRVVPRRSGWD